MISRIVLRAVLIGFLVLGGMTTFLAEPAGAWSLKDATDTVRDATNTVKQGISDVKKTADTVKNGPSDTEKRETSTADRPANRRKNEASTTTASSEAAVSVILKNESSSTVTVELIDQYGGNFSATIEPGMSQNHTLKANSQVKVNGSVVHVIVPGDQGKSIVVAR